MDQVMIFTSQRQNWHHPVLIGFMLYGMTSGNNEALVSKIEVLLNDMVSLYCHTNASVDIQWHFNSLLNYVFAGGRLWYPYKERFRTEDDKAGTHTLIISKVKSEYAGWYYCSEEETGRRISSTHLTVLYSNPVCYSNMHPDGFIGPNTCNLQQENMIFNCFVSFNGTSPHLMWRILNDNRTLNSTICEDKPNRRNCSLILKSDPIYDGSIFICQTSSSIESSFNCSTEDIEILYFSSTNDTAKKYVNDNVNCSAKSNLNVTFNWTLQQSNKVSFLSSKQTLLIQNPGIYHCEVNYSLKNYSCITLASVVNVSVESTVAETTSGSTTLATILSTVLAFSVLSIGIFMLTRKLKKWKRENDRRENERREKEIRENERKESERRENERIETERKENERRENKRIRKKLDDMQEYFVSNVDPQDVLEPLIHDHVISKEESDIVLNKATIKDNCQALLDHLSSSSHTTSYIVLKNALDIYYPWIAVQIGTNDENPVSKKLKNERIKDKVVSMYVDFTSEVDPKNVFDLLIRTRIVNPEEKRELLNKDTANERCRVLIDHLFFCSKENAFIILREALKKLYPKIVERIDASDEDCETKDITITGMQENERIRNRVVVIYEDFVSEVDPKKILDFLIQNKIVNLKQGHHLKNQSTTKDQCEALLDLLYSFPRENEFIILREALKENYPRIVESIDSPTTDDEEQNNPNRKPTMRLESSIIVLGKENSNDKEINVFKINLNRPDEVSALQPLPIEVDSDIAAAVYCGSVFVTGIGRNKNEIWRFDAKYPKWNQCASMINGKLGPSVAFVDQVLYICGGRGFYYGKLYYGVTDGVFAYDVYDDKISLVGQLNYTVYNAGNCVPNKSSLYIFGGKNALHTYVNSVQVYNTKLNSCTILTNTMPRNEAVMCALFKNYGILLGQRNCFLYNFDGKTWIVRDQFKTDFIDLGMTAHNENLFVIGSSDSKDNLHDEVKYVPISNIFNDDPIEWKHHAILPKPFEVHAFAKLEFLAKQI